jgi:stress response protein SCP2
MNIMQKDQKFNLSQSIPNLSKLLVGLGWKVNAGGEAFDLDASAFMLTTENTIRDTKDFVYYNNLQDPSGILKHSGDNLQGGQGDCEQILVDLTKMPPELGHITFVVTIYDAYNRNQTFGKVSDAYIRICDANTNQEIARYNLGEEFFNATSIVFGDVAKFNNEWFFDAVGVAFSGGLEAIAGDFDIDVVKRA